MVVQFLQNQILTVVTSQKWGTEKRKVADRDFLSQDSRTWAT